VRNQRGVDQHVPQNVPQILLHKGTSQAVPAVAFIAMRLTHAHTTARRSVHRRWDTHSTDFGPPSCSRAHIAFLFALSPNRHGFTGIAGTLQARRP
jgi:hypothetical protein